MAFWLLSKLGLIFFKSVMWFLHHACGELLSWFPCPEAGLKALGPGGWGGAGGVGGGSLGLPFGEMHD